MPDGTQLVPTAEAITRAKIAEILSAVAEGVPVEQAVAGVNVEPLAFDRYLISKRGGATRKALAVAIAQADRSDLDKMTADSEAFGWQASLARVKMRREMESARAVRETNLLCNEMLWG